MSSSDTSPERTLVVDGGGTKTRCLVFKATDQGRIVVGTGVGPGCNPNTRGLDAAVTAIREAVQRAVESAGLPASTCVRRGAFAIAGALDQRVRCELGNRLEQAELATETRVFPDYMPVVLAASITGPAVAVIAGTGSTVVVRKPSGQLSCFGGWGYLLGDEGSGYAIGRAAIRLLLAQAEQIAEPTPFALRLFEHLGIQSAAEVKAWVYRAADARLAISSLAKPVLHWADGGDADACRITSDAEEHIHSLILRAILRCNVKPAGTAIALAGGVLQADNALGRALGERLRDHDRFSQVTHISDPAIAAQLLLDDRVFDSPIEMDTR